MTISTNLYQLDLNLLKIFEALYREQNMTRVASLLHLTPSAVSHAIKRLRSSLNDELFVRRGQRMQPTPACDAIAPVLLDNLARLRQILQQFAHFEPAESHQQFRLGMHFAQESLILPRLIKQLAQHAPNVHLASVQFDRTKLQHELSAGHLDMVIDVAMPMREPVLHHKLITDQLIVVSNAQYFASGVTQQQYLNASHIAVSNRPTGTVIEDFALSQLGFNRHIAHRCQHYAAACSIVAQTDYLLTLPQQLFSNTGFEQLQQHAVPMTLNQLDIHLYWHQNTQHNPAHIWLRQQITELFN
ncbi:LysR family transcriptional regulator [Neptunicella marina]|uniref:LysR family transcriptional regulator n=1 Tax=Neptunicella marina TaxID=2125989 RepID=A0A8J6M0W4_9ALTE|nr:LysR family transcriptional regulator [Neptunicella marina]MBC3767424.1 LysR family transcriptional regulator [Neptunicella marina]